MLATRPFSSSCLVAFLLLLSQGVTAAADLTQDDIDFQKGVYAEKSGAEISYRLFVPLGYDTDRKYPLLLWLHGNRGRGSDNVKQITGENQLGAHYWVTKELQLKFSMFVLAPQCPSGQDWSDPEFNEPSKWLRLAMGALAKVEKEYSIDPDRVYLAGQSMGGLGVWSLLQAYPETWAAAVVMSAYDTFTDVHAIARVPLWVFQGDADDSVPVTMVRSMMEQLKKAHANLRYTEYHKVDHEVWYKAYAEVELFTWLTAQKRGSPAGGQVGSGTTPPSR